jgi:uncharacterized membrane protein (UPF0127 family)
MKTGLIRQFFAAFAMVGMLAFSACASAQTPQNPVGPTDPLTIVSGDTSHAFKVELADTPKESEMGLMHRSSMPKDHGMIFDFRPEREVNMWMKNTLIPLDMLFLDGDGTVLAIAENARPHSERLVGPGIPVSSVLELNAGMVKELGIKPGDKVLHKLFGNYKPNG